MASSMNYAQDVKKITCNLCKVSDDAVWFCKQCIKNLCNSCKEVHSNIPQCENHTVVSVIEGLQIDKNINTTCTTHKNQLDFFCRSCDLKICAECLTETHRLHDFSLLSEHVKHLEGILKDQHDKKERDLQMIQQKIHSLEEHIARYKEEMKECGKEMRTSAARKITQIHGMERKLQEMLDTKEKENVSKMESQLRDLKKVESEHGKLLQSLNENRSNTIPSTFIDFMKDSDKIIQSLDVDMTLKLPNAQRFVRNETDTLNPGTLQNDKSSQMNVKIISNRPYPETDVPILRKDLRIIKTCFDTSIGSRLVSINVIDEDRVWVGLVNNKLLLMDNLKVQRRFNLPISPKFTALLKSGALLISCGATIKQIGLQGDLRNFTDLSPVCKKVLTMVTTDQDEILACLSVEDKRYKVVKLSSDGSKLLELEIPMLTSTKMSEIHAGLDSRYFIHNGDKIVIIDQMGNFIQDITCTGKLLEVWAIAIDKYGRIIGAKDNELFVFSSDGTHLFTYDISHLKDIHQLYAFVVDKNDNLWLGLFEKMSIVKYYQ